MAGRPTCPGVATKDEDKAATAAHTEIIEAIESRDPDAAEAAMRRHLDRHYGTYMQLKKRLAPD
ncbi:hypothetical protein HORIV_59670 [Vreelandella olivaria]|uniref:GntR C-terminal domain-containing protein n=1 Tax=Vreelandella olivaria TaxID=390919 RepID=A0ABM7GS44_9GAMM|nr:hypothetical protein HORIV_59670 [Halomonas olivaria]